MDKWDSAAMIAHTMLIPWSKQRMSVEDFHPYRSKKSDLAQLVEDHKHEAKPLPETITPERMEEVWSGIKEMVDGSPR